MTVGRARRLLAVAGVVSLALGALFYAVSRGGTRLLPSIVGEPTTLGLPAGVAGGLPTLLHTFAFSALTAAVLLPKRGSWFIAPLLWVLLGGLLELVQHPTATAWLAESGAASGAAGRDLLRYSQAGTLSPADIIGLALGAAGAAALIRRLTRCTVSRQLSPMP